MEGSGLGVYDVDPLNEERIGVFGRDVLLLDWPGVVFVVLLFGVGVAGA